MTSMSVLRATRVTTMPRVTTQSAPSSVSATPGTRSTTLRFVKVSPFRSVIMTSNEIYFLCLLQRGYNFNVYKLKVWFVFLMISLQHIAFV